MLNRVAECNETTSHPYNILSLPLFCMNTHYVPSRRKLLAGATAIAVTLSLLPFQAFGAFSDIGDSTSYSTAIKDLESKGVIEGYADGTFKPTSGINRAEFLKILLEARGDVAMDGKNCFPDVRDEWFAKYVCAAKAEGIVAGYPDGAFKPAQSINFVEAGKMLALAYKQDAQHTGGEWYEPYARALESSKAIPPSIETLDAPLDRGEMAEMMWRIAEEKTDQPNKSYMNVKYPEIKADLSSDQPQFAKSCTDLKAFVSESQVAYPPMNYMMRGVMNDAVAAPTAAEGKSTAGSSDGYSTTNVQVAGVDEGDIVKTNGSYVYVLSRRDSTIRIVDVRDTAKPVVVSKIKDENFTTHELYVDGNVLVVTGNLSMAFPYPVPMEDSVEPSAKMMIWPGPNYAPKTTVKLYDVSTASSPKNIRTVSFEGSSISTRLVGGKLLLALMSGPRWYAPYAETKQVVSDALVPVYDDTAGNIRDKAVTDCTRVTILPRVPRPQYLTVASVPLNATAAVKSSVILGDGQNVYASTDNLYVVSTEWMYSWGRPMGSDNQEKTNLYRFAYGSDGSVNFEANGSVPGHILNQFSMDEHGDIFRIATTTSPQWMGGETSSVSKNQLYVLNHSLETVGSIEDIAPGESIYSVRFFGDRAYIVTFKQIDPFFVIDTSDARNPKILGKLKIPGYSNYLHPVGENHVIGFGKDVDESIDKDKVHDDNSVYYTAILGMKLSLFDVTDVSNPIELSKEIIGTRGTDSPLLSDHKALFFDQERGLLAFPVTVYEKITTPKVNEWDSGTQAVFQGAYVYNFSVKDGFSLKGKISHHASDAYMKAGDYWYDSSGKDISRILRVGTSLLTVSDAKLQSNSISTLGEQGSATLSTSTDGQMTPPYMIK